MAIQWGNNSALAGFQNALALGADIGGAIRQNREDNALAAFMTTQTPETQSALMKVNPKLGMQAQDRIASQQAAQAKLMQEQRAADLRTKAAQGDPDALQQLVGIDFDSWKTLDANKRKMVADQNTYIGQSALRISQLPAEQQAAEWDNAIAQGVSMGFQELGKQRGQYSPQALRGAIDNAGLVDKFLSLAEPKYTTIPEGGTLVNTRDPEAVRQFQGGAIPPAIPPANVITPQQALKAATARGYVLPDEATAIKSGLGANGQAAFEGWLEQNKVKMVTRTGTAPDGRKVVQFSDGTTQYAD